MTNVDMDQMVGRGPCPVGRGDLLAAAVLVQLHGHPGNRAAAAERIRELADWLGLEAPAAGGVLDTTTQTR